MIWLNFLPAIASGSNDAPPAQDKPFASVTPRIDDADLIFLTVRVNGQDFDEPSRLIRTRDGGLLARAEDLKRWRLAPPSRAFNYMGDDYYPLAALPNLHYRVDEAQQQLLIEVDPQAFPTTYISGRKTPVTPAAVPSPGGFINYDLFAQKGPDLRQLSGLLEFGAFNRWGVATNTVLGQRMNSRFSQTRLETTFTRDRPADMSSLHLGDAISRPGMWGGSVRFGGIQWASNFSLQPNFISFPLPGFRGEAALPSTIDLYINNTLAMSKDVPPGPFAVNSLPVMVGEGDIQMVQRDILGRRQIVSRPYYASPALLRAGLQDFSYELGFIRDDFGIASGHYGSPLITGTQRQGLTDRLTGEGHVELQRDRQALGLGGSYLQPRLGVVSAALAGSHAQSGWGDTFLIQIDRQMRRLSYGARLQLASRRFTSIGAVPGQAATRRLINAYLGFSPGQGSLTLSFTGRRMWQDAPADIVSVNYGIQLFKDYVVNFSLLSLSGAASNRTVGITLTHPLDPRTTLSADALRQNAGGETTMAVQRNLPLGAGVGYRALVGTGDLNYLEAGASLKNDVGIFHIDTAHLHDQSSYQLGASGGIGILDGHALLARRLDGSFALVDVPGYPGVGVYENNQLVTHTNVDGRALIADLLPYQGNPIHIDSADIPLDAQIDSLDILASPHYRSGVLLRFPIKPANGALISIVLEDGSPLPAGAVVGLKGREAKFPVALHGEVYVTGLAADNRLRATWRGKSCAMAVKVSAAGDPLPHIGPLLCKGIKP